MVQIFLWLSINCFLVSSFIKTIHDITYTTVWPIQYHILLMPMSDLSITRYYLSQCLTYPLPNITYANVWPIHYQILLIPMSVLSITRYYLHQCLVYPILYITYATVWPNSPASPPQILLPGMVSTTPPLSRGQGVPNVSGKYVTHATFNDSKLKNAIPVKYINLW